MRADCITSWGLGSAQACRLLLAGLIPSLTCAVAQDAAPEATPAPSVSNASVKTAFRIRYVAAGVAYLEGGKSTGLTEGMKLVVRDVATSAGGSASAAGAVAEDGSSAVDPREIAVLSVLSVAESSAVAEVKSSRRALAAGDVATLSSEDVQALVAQESLGATLKYPAVVTFTDGDPLEQEVRDEVPHPPLPEVDRAGGRFGLDYSTLIDRNGSGLSSSQLGGDVRYSRFQSAFGDGSYESFSLSRNLSEQFRLEVLAGQQSYTSSVALPSQSRFLTANAEYALGLHYFAQGTVTVQRGGLNNYDQFSFSVGYRFDNRGHKGER